MTDRPTPNQGPCWGSDVVAEALREQGFPYVCLNPGASFRGLHDSIVNYLGNKTPEMLVCLHEEHAIAIAHGFALVTGEPLAAIVHSNVGLMHASMAIFNAWCERVPMLILGATGPVDAARRRPWIDWIHTSADQGALVRDYTKWDDQPGSAAAAVESIRRACQISRTRPAGPVYINLDVDLQEGELPEWPQVQPVSRFKTPAEVRPAETDVEAASKLLKGAKGIVFLAGRTSRDEQAWDARVKLAERLGAQVLTHGSNPASFPTDHPLHLGEAGLRLKEPQIEALKSADVIVSLDWVDLAGLLSELPAEDLADVKVVQCSNDFHIHRGWSMDYQGLPPVDVSMATTPEMAVTALTEALDKAGFGGEGRNYAPATVPLPELETSGEIRVYDLACHMAHAIDGAEVSVISRPIGWPPNANIFRHPLDHLGKAAGAGVGAGPGMAVGAALALRDMGSSRIPLTIVGDGDYLMGVTALWTAVANKIPLLMVVANNRSYFNDELHQRRVAQRRSRDESRAWIGQAIAEPAPDLAMLAKGQGADGEGPITDLADLPGAIERAFAAVKAGKTYVLDVVVKGEYSQMPVFRGADKDAS